jgi:hypothetical protein
MRIKLKHHIQFTIKSEKMSGKTSSNVFGKHEPGQYTPLSAWPYAPEYLDLLEAWLIGFQQ